MKIVIVYLLLCVPCITQTMQENDSHESKSVMANKDAITDSSTARQIIGVHESIVVDLTLLPKAPRVPSAWPSSATLLTIPQEIQLIVYESVADIIAKEKISLEENFQRSIKNFKALACVCRTFRRLSTDEQMNGRVILKWSGRLNSTGDSLYWRLYTLANQLGNQGALRWFAGQKINEMGITKKIEQITSEQRTCLRETLIKIVGGLTVNELRFLDLRPINVIEHQEPAKRGQVLPAPTRSLTLKACSLRNLVGIECTRDLYAIDLLDISGNRLTTIDPGFFNRFERLTRVDLAHNELLSVNLNIFARLSQLRSLDLYCNKIEEVTGDEQFTSMELQTVNLNSNQLKYVNPKVLTKIPARLIDLRGNPLQNREEIRALSKPVTNRILFDEN